MPSCGRVALCPLFKLFATKSSLRVWQMYFCEGDYRRCERWKLAAAERPVPNALLPNGKLLEVSLEALQAEHLY